MLQRLAVSGTDTHPTSQHGPLSNNSCTSVVSNFFRNDVSLSRKFNFELLEGASRRFGFIGDNVNTVEACKLFGNTNHIPYSLFGNNKLPLPISLLS